MVETLATSGAVKHRVGSDAPTTITNSGAWMTELINQAEGDICAETRVNWIDIYSTMNADFKQVLEGACAAKAAIKVISYAPAEYPPNAAMNMINVLWSEYDRAITILKDEKNLRAIGGTLITT